MYVQVDSWWRKWPFYWTRLKSSIMTWNAFEWACKSGWPNSTHVQREHNEQSDQNTKIFHTHVQKEGKIHISIICSSITITTTLFTGKLWTIRQYLKAIIICNLKNVRISCDFSIWDLKIYIGVHYFIYSKPGLQNCFLYHSP